MMKWYSKKQSGITLLETIIYAIILLLVLLVIVQILGSILTSHRRALSNRLVESSAMLAMEKMVREIKLAEAVNLGGSSLGTNPGTLALSGVDALGNPYSIVFDVSSGVARVTKDAGSPGPITSQSVTIAELMFERVANATSEGVRITLELTANVGNQSKTLEVQNFAILRGSY